MRVLPDQPVEMLVDYVQAGGGQALARSAELGPEGTIDEISRAGLRGRGGAGFPTGRKWDTIMKGGGRHHYVVCNAAEGEPGTFKDRAILRTNPFQVIEGLVVAARTVGAIEAFLALKDSFETEVGRVTGAVAEMEEAGWLGDLKVTVVTGPEEYLFGEEKALLEVIEGSDPMPRWLPPYMHGLYATTPQLGWLAHSAERGHGGEHYSNPTLVNNAETLSQAAWILRHGPEEFRQLGTTDSPGTVVVTLVGDVAHPDVVEVEMGTPVSDVLERCGGPRPGRSIKGVLSGVANGVLTADRLDTPLTYEDMQAAGSGLGAAGLIFYDDSACMVEVATTLSRFLYVESCGQCLPCKLGTEQITEALERLRAASGSEEDLDIIEQRLRVVADGNRCFLPVQEQTMISSILGAFPEDVTAHLEGGCLAPGRTIPTPKIVDIADGAVTYDERQERKQPDWTYREA